MLHKPYKLIIEPKSTNPDERNRELILNWVLFGILSLLFISSINGLVRFFFFHEHALLMRLIAISLVFLILIFYCLVLRSHAYFRRIASFLIVASIFASAVFMVATWGIANSFGILTFGLAIVASGIILGSKYALYVALATSTALAFFEYARQHALITPDTTWTRTPSSAADVINFSTLFLIIALISWLFNRQMESSLRRARRSEKALKQERDLLEIKVEERTRELQEAQLEKVQQVYKFAELGHLSTALFHDLAGNLSSLSLDIETMRKSGDTDFSKRIDNNIQYIDDVVRRVKSQIRGNDALEMFDMVSEAKDLVGILAYNARKARTSIVFEEPKSLPIYFTGNLTRFRQLIINLLSNAIEAYPPAGADVSVKDRPVILKMAESDTHITISVTDFGQGIQKKFKEKIFDPFYSTKSSGSGIGLFIVKQVTESDFSGTITLKSSKKSGTTFSITIPK